MTVAQNSCCALVRLYTAVINNVYQGAAVAATPGPRILDATSSIVNVWPLDGIPRTNRSVRQTFRDVAIREFSELLGFQKIRNA